MAEQDRQGALCALVARAGAEADAAFARLCEAGGARARELEAPPGCTVRIGAATELLRDGEGGSLALEPRSSGARGFALVRWDPRASRLELARDAAGVRSLFIAERGTPQGIESVLVARRVAHLLAAGLDRRRLDPLALASYLWRGDLSGTRTLAVGLRRVPAGGRLAIDALRRTLREEPASEEVLALASPGSDSPAEPALLAQGVLVSGGAGSSALARAARAAGARLVHLDVADPAARAAVEALARALGLDLMLLEADPARLDRWLERLPEAVDEPGIAAVEAFAAAELAREAGLASAVLGTGGAERFAPSALPPAFPLPRSLARPLARRALARDDLPGPWTRGALTGRSLVLRHQLASALVTPGLAHRLLDRERLPPLELGLARERRDELEALVTGRAPEEAWRVLAHATRAGAQLAALDAASGEELELLAPWLALDGRGARVSLGAGLPAVPGSHALARALARHLAGPRRERLLDELGARDAADALGLVPDALRAQLEQDRPTRPDEELCWLALWLLARWSRARSIRV